MYKLVTCKDFKKPVWIENAGNLNILPAPYVEITAQEFWYEFFKYSIEYTEFRQISSDDIDNVRLFWFWHCCLAISKPKKYDKIDDKSVCLDNPRFFYIGCKHSFNAIVRSMHESTLKCSKCGLSTDIDSSG